MADLNSIGGIHYEMMRRCYNEKSIAYKDYGAKGIVVCEEWHDRENFRKWSHENGYVKGLRLDRIDSKGNYTPDNCVFGECSKKKPNGESQYHKNVRKTRVAIMKECCVPKNYASTRIHRIYASMHCRCDNKNHVKFDDYGGRGIKVCNEWSGKYGFFYFYKWATENGYRDDLTIDRINNDIGYCPDNCRWATVKEQIHNRRISRNYMYHGEIKNLADISRESGVGYRRIREELIRECINVNDNIDELVDSMKN